MSVQWYLRRGNQSQGPFSPAQMRDLAAAGTLSPSDLVWKQGLTQWTSASSLKGLFPTADGKTSQPAQTAQRLPVEGSQGWYIAQDRKKLGPFSLSQMKASFASGQLCGSDMVWEEGMPKWVAAASVFQSEERAAANPVLAEVAPQAAQMVIAPHTEAQAWQIARGEQRYGAFSETQMKQMAANGQLQPTDMVWTPGEMQQWVLASSLREFFPFVEIPETPAPRFERRANEAAVDFGRRERSRRMSNGCCWYCRQRSPIQSVQCPYCRALLG